MKITPLAFVALVWSFAAFNLATAARRSPSTNRYLAFVGTYTSKTDSKGIYAFEFDAGSGKLTPKGLDTETPRASWFVVPPRGKFAYAANDAGRQSSITAFSTAPKLAKLTRLNQLPA